MNAAILTIYIKIAAILVFAAIASKYSIELMAKLLHRAGCIRMNYRRKEVSIGAGIAFVPVILIASALSLVLFPNDYIIYLSYFFVLSTIGFAGILDDMIGEKDIKGLRNHIKSFLNGHLTTGFIKAFIGFLTALIVSMFVSKGVFHFILNIFVIALFTNAMNLMDLRPGRCTKTFLLIGLIIFVSNLENINLVLPLGIALIACAVYLPYDLKELCMLGDTGSNILGATLGYFCAVSYTAPVKLMLFVVLLIINIAAEKVSLTTVISKNRFLNYLDNMGRSSG